MTRRTPKPAPVVSAPACTVMVFPLYRRLGKVRRVAEVYAGMSNKEAESYWRVQCNAMFRKLLWLGCTKAESDAELSAFREAVSAELTRRAYFNTTSNRPDGAA